MCEMKGTIWLFAISVLMLVAVLAFRNLTGFVSYGSPAEVIKTFFSACNSGNYSVAEGLLVPEANRVLTRHIGAVDGGLRGICDQETKQGHVQRVEVLQQEVHGELAQVRYMLYYADGSTIEDSQGLVLRRWVWKIAPLRAESLKTTKASCTALPQWMRPENAFSGLTLIPEPKSNHGLDQAHPLNG
jgi:hypothetical protein